MTMKTLHSQEDGEEPLHYCQNCRKLRPLEIKGPKEAGYYSQDISAVACRNCGKEMGHVTWWPYDDR